MSTAWKVVSIVTLVAVIVVAGAVVMAKSPVVNAQGLKADPTAAQTGISVVGQGKVTAKPDVAYLTVGVQTTAATAKEAMDENNASVAAVIEKLSALGVDKKDMQTGSISLYPQMKQPKPDGSGENEISGYSANNSLNVTVNDLAKVGIILDGAVSSGANTVSGLRFDIKDSSKLQDLALQAAIKDAQSRADLVAAGLGLKVSGVQTVAVDSVGVPGPIYYDAAMAAPRAAGASVPVEAGQLTFNASVRITFGF